MMKRIICMIFACCLIYTQLFASGVLFQAGGVAPSGGTDGSVGTITNSAQQLLYGGSTYYTAYTATPGYVRYAHIKINDGNSATICVALKNSSGTNLLNGSASAGDDTIQWVNIDCGSTETLTASTYYVSVQVDKDVRAYYLGGQGIIAYEAALACGANIATGGSQLSAGDLTIIFDNSPGDPE